MSKKFLIAVVIAITLAGVGYAIYYRQELKKNSSANSSNVAIDTLQNKQPDTTNANLEQTQIPNRAIKKSSDWKIYTNTKLGFTFQYPAEWNRDEKDAEVVNRFGVATEIDLNFTDTISQTSLLVAYHFSPSGKQLYDYALSQQVSNGGKEVTVAGSNAIKTNNIINADGRGHAVKKLQVIVVDFLDKKQAAEVQLQFKTPLPSEIEVAKFNQLLLGFKFINP